jgi:hypothetical protein
MTYEVTQKDYVFYLVDKKKSSCLTKYELESLGLLIEGTVKQYIENEVMVSDSKTYECLVIGCYHCLVKESSINLDFKKYNKQYKKFIKDNPKYETQATELYNANMNIYARFYNCSVQSLFSDYSKTNGLIKKIQKL